MKLIAHRGIWNKDIKDNSYMALKNALNSTKYIGIECDIRETLDKEFILYHNILYNGNLISSIKYNNLKNIAKLEDILKINSNKIYLLEIKDTNINIEKFLKLLNRYNKNIYLMSFNYNLMKEIKLKTKFKCGILNYILNSDSSYNLDFVCLLPYIATDYVINKFQNNGIEVFIYGSNTVTKDVIYIVDDKNLSQ